MIWLHALLVTGFSPTLSGLAHGSSVLAQNSPESTPPLHASTLLSSKESETKLAANESCTAQTRILPDNTDLAAKRKRLFGSQKTARLDFVIHYALHTNEVLQSHYPADIILKQLAQDWVCELPFAEAQPWLALMPAAKKQLAWIFPAADLIKNWEIDQPHAGELFLPMLQHIQILALKNDCLFDLGYTSLLFDKVKSYAKKHGLEQAQNLLNDAEHHFANLEAPQFFLTQIRAKLLLDAQKFSEAKELIDALEKTDNFASKSWNADLRAEWERSMKLEESVSITVPDLNARIVMGDNQGQMFSLAEQKGKIVILSFWQEWCPVCLAKLPALQDFYEKNRGKDIVLVGISQEESDASFAAIKNIRDKNQISFPQILDKNEKIFDQFGVDALPHIVVIDKDGRIAKVLAGAQTALVFEIVPSSI